MLTKNQLVEAQITAMSSDGNGIAKVDGMVIFVPYSAVGDKLLVRVVKVLKHYSFGIIDRILEPGEGRVQDSCPVYRRCGGCSFRHISYREELVHKHSLWRTICAGWRIGAADAADYPFAQTAGLPQQGAVPDSDARWKGDSRFFCQAQPSGDRLCLL